MNLMPLSDAAPHRRSQNRPLGAGFTLIEVALAIVALGLGVLAAYSLLSLGLETGQKAGADTQAAFFADSVLSSLRVESERAAKQGNWANFWSQLAAGSTTIPVAFQEAWDGDIAVQANQAATLIVFSNYAFRANAPTNIVNNALRYTLTVNLPYSDRAEVLLKVWNGRFGSNSNDTAFTFYSEYSRMGEL